MILPGKVVIIDDKLEEVKDLIKVLTQLGISTLYFDGSLDSMPEKPFNDVSCIFLDINLVEGLTNQRAVEGAVISRIKRIVDKNNIPFVVYVWSKISNTQMDIVNNIFTGVDKITTTPIAIVELNKSSMFNLDGKLKTDQSKVKSMLVKLIGDEVNKDIYKFFQHWNASLEHSFFKLIRDLFSVPDDSEWAPKIKKVINDLSGAYYGKENKRIDVPTKIITAKVLLSEVFIDEMSSYLRSLSTSQYPKNLNISNRASTESTSSLINYNLLFGEFQSLISFPGNCFKSLKTSKVHSQLIQQAIPLKLLESGFDSTKKKRINQLQNKKNKSQSEKSEYKNLEKEKKKFCKHAFNSIKKSAIFGEMVMTPMCDFAQNKNALIKLLPFSFIEISSSSVIKKNNLNDIAKGSYYDTNAVFEFKSKQYILLVNYQNLHTVTPEEIVPRKPLVRAKQQLLYDLQYRLSTNLGRPGVVFIDYRA
jgi:hypothetical protein